MSPSPQGHRAPEAHGGGARVVNVHVVTVSTSRSASTDVSGPLLQELIVGAGHAVAGTSLVADDPDAIGAALDTLLGDARVDAVVLTGGTGVSARDCTPVVVRARLDRELPGFGELFRMLSWEQVGAAAMLSTAVGGIAAGRPVFALPGSPKACRLAMEKLILPSLGHLVGELGKETPLPGKAPATASRPARVGIAATPAGTTPPPAEGEADAPPHELVTQRPGAGERPAEEDIATGWRAGMRALGGELRRVSQGEIPESLERIAAAMDVLHAAGDRALFVLPDGREYTAFGYPDLVRNGSKVLLVREGAPVAEVVALHRWPRRVGICIEGDDGVLPSADLAPGPVAEERTGAAFDGTGQLFAVESASIYVLQGRRVAQFDGRNIADGWPMTSAIGTLLLHWSQR
jgi:molybdenum cofactor biosynthesis protein B